jgi:hypothetical protein
MFIFQMPGAEHGLERGFGMVLEAAVVAFVFNALVEADLMPKLYFTLFNVVSIVALVFLVDKSRYWSFGYLFGWIFGLVMSIGTLAQTQLIGVTDIVIYFLTLTASIYLRVKIHSNSF